MNGLRGATTDQLILEAADLMRQQAEAYGRLDAICLQLVAGLAQNGSTLVEGLVRAGESELLRMRARLVQIMGVLNRFADARASAEGAGPVAPDARAAFETASGELMTAAQAFQRTHARAAALATSGSSFASACIEMCGVPPTTYRAPYARAGARRWA